MAHLADSFHGQIHITVNHINTLHLGGEFLVKPVDSMKELIDSVNLHAHRRERLKPLHHPSLKSLHGVEHESRLRVGLGRSRDTAENLPLPRSASTGVDIAAYPLSFPLQLISNRRHNLANPRLLLEFYTHRNDRGKLGTPGSEAE